MRIPRRLPALAALLVVALAGCGDDEPSADEAGAPVTEITITSDSVSFDVDAFAVPVGRPVTVTYVNDHEGVQHNISFDLPEGDAATEVVAGPETRDVELTVDEPGEYTYVCEVHPRQMRGTVHAE